MKGRLVNVVLVRWGHKTVGDSKMILDEINEYGWTGRRAPQNGSGVNINKK